MVVHVYQLVDEGMFHVLLVEEMARAKHHCSRIRTESTSTAQVARGAENVGSRDRAAGQFKMIEHEHHGRAYTYQHAL
jgi:hypothetical protein